MYTIDMDSTNLTSQQLDSLTFVVTRSLRFLRMLQQRVNANRFPADDSLRLAVQSALVTSEALHATLRRLSADRLRTHDDYFGNMSRRQWKQEQERRRNQ